MDSMKSQNMDTMPLRSGHYRVLVTASMEQIIGAGLSTIVGIIIPLLQLAGHPDLSAFLQGVLGSIGLIGIAMGSMILGRLSDRYGYLFFFRLCPLLILAGALLIYFTASIGCLIPGLFLIGFGVGGGYSLDTDYISEIMPVKWKSFMVGVAKATSSIGFFAVAGCAFLILREGFEPAHWNRLILIIGTLGAVTFLMRLPFRQSPRWLMDKGDTARAQQAARYFLGPDTVITPEPKGTSGASALGLSSFFKGEMLKKVIFSGIPWACEGVGVYGVGVFLPVLVMALGIAHEPTAGGMDKIISSVELTTVINFFIVPGFVIGLLMVRRFNHLKMLTRGFWISALGLVLLLLAYLLKWPVWVSVAGFVIFELSLNAGPHLITFIIPSQIYDVDNRGTGAGIAAMTGKIGAILGVFFMPVLLKAGGIVTVLVACIIVSCLGALISAIYGKMVLDQK